MSTISWSALGYVWLGVGSTICVAGLLVAWGCRRTSTHEETRDTVINSVLLAGLWPFVVLGLIGAVCYDVLDWWAARQARRRMEVRQVSERLMGTHAPAPLDDHY